MKRIFFVFTTLLLFITNLPAQNKDSVIVVDLWVPAAQIGLNLSQISLNNWTQGGDNSLTWTIILSGGIKHLGSDWNFRNNLKAAYGRTKLGSQDFRTNDNELFFETVLSKNIKWAVDPYFSNSIRTSITTGYNYKKTPPEKIADFFDPGYVTQGVGFTYDKLSGFIARVGFAVKETFTNRFRQYSDDTSTTKLEAFKVETGLESALNGDFQIMENVQFKSSLRLFTRYERLDIWDVRWDNIVTAKVNKLINVNFAVLLIYEKKQSVYTQLKQSLQLGITYSFFEVLN